MVDRARRRSSRPTFSATRSLAVLGVPSGSARLSIGPRILDDGSSPAVCGRGAARKVTRGRILPEDRDQKGRICSARRLHLDKTSHSRRGCACSRPVARRAPFLGGRQRATVVGGRRLGRRTFRPRGPRSAAVSARRSRGPPRLAKCGSADVCSASAAAPVVFRGRGFAKFVVAAEGRHPRSDGSVKELLGLGGDGRDDEQSRPDKMPTEGIFSASASTCPATTCAGIHWGALALQKSTSSSSRLPDEIPARPEPQTFASFSNNAHCGARALPHLPGPPRISCSKRGRPRFLARHFAKSLDRHRHRAVTLVNHPAGPSAKGPAVPRAR